MKLLLILAICIVCMWQNDAVKPKLSKEKLKIVTIESAPFLIVEQDEEKSQELQGFLIDFLEELKTKLGFESEVYLVPDGKFGHKDESGNWHGMIGELVNGKADMALAPLTVNQVRETAVKFTIPYMSAGLVPITKRPTPGKPLPFMDVMDMVQKPELKYGCVNQGSTYDFFQSSSHALYKAMGMAMKDKPEQLAETYEQGIEKVRSEDGYVFFGEEPSMKFYQGGEPCDLLIIGKQLHERFYALAFPNEKQEMASLFNVALLELNERGTKDRLVDKWWEDDCKMPEYCICEEAISSEESGSHENATATDEHKIRVRRDHSHEHDGHGHDHKRVRRDDHSHEQHGQDHIRVRRDHSDEHQEGQNDSKSHENGQKSNSSEQTSEEQN